jgi:predicted acetyltransferase
MANNYYQIEPILLPATIADYPVIQNMARFYAYDISRYCGQSFEGWEFPSDGLYKCRDFKDYFEKKNNHAFLIKVNEELAGFALIDQLEVLPEVDWNMGQFFIVTKFQRTGIGAKIAKQIFDRFHGEWSVGAIPQNTRAVAFWRKVISEYTQNTFHEMNMTPEQLRTAEHPNPFPMILFRFKVGI